MSTNPPSICREQLYCHNIQGVPGRDTQPIVQAQHPNHHRLTGAKPQEEAADTRQNHGKPCQNTEYLQKDYSYT